MKPTRVILHCSDSPDSNDKIGVVEIDRWHRERGFDCVGYHWIIKRNGVLERGRPDHVQGAHVKGHNHDSLGVCWVGRNNPTGAQIVAIVQLYALISLNHKIKYKNWFGHYELDGGKTCPNLDMNMVRFMLQLFDGGYFDLDDVPALQFLENRK